MDVHELAGRLVERVGVEDPRDLLGRGRSSIPETEATDHRVEPLLVPASNQQVEIAVTSNGSILRVVALPVAVRDVLGGERVDQAAHQRERFGDHLVGVEGGHGLITSLRSWWGARDATQRRSTGKTSPRV